MAQPSTQDKAKEAEAHARLVFAVREIEASPSLRHFVRQYLGFCGVLFPTSVFTTDPALNAYNQGVQAAGVEFARMLTSVAPHLWPALQLEEDENEPVADDADE